MVKVALQLYFDMEVHQCIALVVSRDSIAAKFKFLRFAIINLIISLFYIALFYHDWYVRVTKEIHH